MPLTTKSTRRRRLRTNLWNRSPYCTWCGRLTVLTAPSDGIQQPDQATLDHLAYGADRRWRRDSDSVSVLACYACNQRRSHNVNLADAWLLIRDYDWT